MSEQEKAVSRAQGALDDFRETMEREFTRRGKDAEYRRAFWDAFFSEVFCMENKTL